jgi:hypothetical protein
VFEEAVPVRAVGERDVQHLGVPKRLLHAVADGVVVVLGLDDRDREIGLVEEDVVRPLGRTPADQLATHDHPAVGEAHLLAYLRHHVPLRPLDGRRDELRADVTLGERLLVHPGSPLRSNRLRSTRKSAIAASS